MRMPSLRHPKRTTSNKLSCRNWLVEIPTENRFSSLDDSYQEPSVSTPPANPPIVNTQPPPPTNRPITTQNNSDTLPDNVTLNPAIFLCDSNGKFLNEKKIFSSNQEIKCFRCPRLETTRALLQDIHDSPNVIVIHTGTNDLTASSPLNDFIYDLTTLITQASKKFPHSKDIPIFAQIFQFTSLKFIRLLRVVFSCQQRLNRPAVNAVQDSKRKSKWWFPSKSNVSWQKRVSVVEYSVCDQDLLSHVANFVVKDPLHLSDHSPITTWLNINKKSNYNHTILEVHTLTSLPKQFLWENDFA